MRKNVFFLSALATLAMATSCSQDEQQSVNRGSAISFNAALNVTRALDYSSAPDSFKVFGVRAGAAAGDYIIPGVTFQKASGSATWLSTGGNHFWPADSTQMVTFSAYAPVNLTGAVSSDGVKGFTVDDAAAKQVDLVVGTKETNKAGSKNGVSLVFDHALTQVLIKATDTNPAYKCTIKSVGLCNIKKKGDYDFKNKTWTADEPANFIVKNDTVLDGKKATAVNNLMGATAKDFKLIPQQVVEWDKDKSKDVDQQTEQAYFIINLEVVSSGGDKVHNGDVFVPVPGITWEAGKRYTYTLDFSNGFGYDKKGKPIVDSEPIKFVNVTVSDWGDGDKVPVSAGEKKTANP